MFLPYSRNALSTTLRLEPQTSHTPFKLKSISAGLRAVLATQSSNAFLVAPKLSKLSTDGLAILVALTRSPPLTTAEVRRFSWYEDHFCLSFISADAVPE